MKRDVIYLFLILLGAKIAFQYGFFAGREEVARKELEIVTSDYLTSKNGDLDGGVLTEYLKAKMYIWRFYLPEDEVGRDLEFGPVDRTKLTELRLNKDISVLSLISGSEKIPES